MRGLKICYRDARKRHDCPSSDVIHDGWFTKAILAGNCMLAWGGESKRGGRKRGGSG